MKKWIIIVAGVILVAAAAGGIYAYRSAATTPKAYRTALVERGDVVQTVRATGVVQPIRLIQVGTQVNGPIRKLNVDYNDRVRAGDVVAQIDPAVYQAHLARDKANLVQSEANVEETTARLAQADKDLVRSRELAKRDMLPQSDLDAAIATRDALAAQVKVAQAAVEQARAALQTSQTELGYTTICSPVDGVIISRNVSEGQTVVASMSAQVLFTIATDLQEVQVEASIPEADIGRIRLGQPVSFTVDAYDEAFTGTVSQIRLAAATVQNVVTYPVVIKAANPSGKLFPSMTANIACEVARSTGVLKIANAALRFTPPDTTAQSNSVDRAKWDGKPRFGGRGKGERHGRGAKVWVQTPEGAVRPVRVAPGISDGTSTELTDAGNLEEGAEVLIGLADPSSATASETVNPFAPRMPRGARPPR